MSTPLAPRSPGKGGLMEDLHGGGLKRTEAENLAAELDDAVVRFMDEADGCLLLARQQRPGLLSEERLKTLAFAPADQQIMRRYVNGLRRRRAATVPPVEREE
jgi:hypothetical protein